MQNTVYAVILYSMKPLESLIQQLENQISNASISNLSVSHSSVGWQIEHSLLTIKLITEQLKKSDTGQYKWTFNIGRMLILTMQKIPRGKANAPKIVVPKEDITSESLKETIRQTRESIQVLNTLQKNHYFEHPYFGKLNVQQTMRFLHTHTKHHLAIIHDILK